jgi:hypothetical protein
VVDIIVFVRDPLYLIVFYFLADYTIEIALPMEFPQVVVSGMSQEPKQDGGQADTDTLSNQVKPSGNGVPEHKVEQETPDPDTSDDEEWIRRGGLTYAQAEEKFAWFFPRPERSFTPSFRVGFVKTLQWCSIQPIREEEVVPDVKKSA